MTVSIRSISPPIFQSGKEDFSLPRLRLFFIPVLFGLLGCLLHPQPLRAQSQDSPLAPDTASIRDSALSHADSLALADTVQPELRVGVFAGGQTTNASVSNVDLIPSPHAGFHAGIRAEMEFGYPVYFLVEFEFAQKGIKSTYTLLSGTKIEEEYNFNYLDIPILYRAGIPISGRYSLSLGFGAHISFLLASNQVIRVAEIDSSTRIERGLERFDFALEGRLGGEYSISPKLSMSADLRYLHGLQNLLILASQQDDRVWKSRGIFFSVGLMYQLQRSIRK